MTDQITLEVHPRNEQGTGASRRMRRVAGMVPGVLYGAKGETESIMIPDAQLNKALQGDSLFSQILNVKLGKKQIPAVVRDLQRHPANDRVLHFDLLRISEDREIQVSVPLRFLNEDACVGVKQGGGNIARTLTELEVRCLPKDLPEYIEIDLLEIEAGQTIHLSEVELPKGVAHANAQIEESEYDSPVVTVTLRRGGLLDEDAEVLAQDVEQAESPEDGEAG